MNIKTCNDLRSSPSPRSTHTHTHTHGFEYVDYFVVSIKWTFSNLIQIYIVFESRHFACILDNNRVWVCTVQMLGWLFDWLVGWLDGCVCSHRRHQTIMQTQERKHKATTIAWNMLLVGINFAFGLHFAFTSFCIKSDVVVWSKHSFVTRIITGNAHGVSSERQTEMENDVCEREREE